MYDVGGSIGVSTLWCMFLCNVYAFISVISSGLTMTVRVYTDLWSSLCVRNHFYALISYKHINM